MSLVKILTDSTCDLSQEIINSRNIHVVALKVCFKEEVYLDMLKSYGQSMMIPVLKGQKPNGYCKYCEYETTSMVNGKEADWYKVYKGSSHYDRGEMSILLEGIIQECNNLEIPTITDEEYERLLNGWNAEE
mgnify:CR=1 FL=1